MSYFYPEGDIVTYQNNMIIYVWDRKEIIIPEKENQKALREPGFYEQIWLPGQDSNRLQPTRPLGDPSSSEQRVGGLTYLPKD